MNAQEPVAGPLPAGRISMVGVGDSLITRKLALYTESEYLALVELLRSADVRVTNLETLFHDYEGYPSAESGGTWVASEPQLLHELTWMGFNLFGCANNHCMDWSWGGLAAHLRTLNQAGVAWAGAGRDAAEARRPAYLELGAGRVGLVSLTTTMPASGRAGEARPDCQGRPGASMLRYFAVYSPDQGFIPTGFYQADAEKILLQIRGARRQADWVICSLHSHEQPPGQPAVPLPFQRDFCHAAVDAGADAVICHGPHVLRGVEVYRGKPIFHGLGNFLFQNETLARQPADFFEQLGLGPDATVAEAFDARNAGEGSFTRSPAYWESVVAYWRYEGGDLAEVKLYPITLGYGQPRTGRGRPVMAYGEQAGRIIGRVAQLSQAFGVNVRLVDGTGVVEL